MAKKTVAKKAVKKAPAKKQVAKKVVQRAERDQDKADARAAAPQKRKTRDEPMTEGGGRYFDRPKEEVNFIRSGSHMLDLALGGGWVRGRIANIVGDRAAGKTLVAIEAFANFGKDEPKGKMHYLESEAAFDKGYAKALGMPAERIKFGDGHPLETVERFYDMLEGIIEKAKEPTLVCLDSLDALSDEKELEREITDGSYGAAKAKLMSEVFRRCVARMEARDVTLLIVSQVRDKIGVSFGDKTSRSGGRALDFYATHILKLAHLGRMAKTITGRNSVYGTHVKAQVAKNKISLPFREATFDIRFGYGIDDPQSCIDFLKLTKNLKAAGITEAGSKDYLDWLLKQDRDYEAKRMAELRDICSGIWYDIESKSITSRGKYT